MKWILGILLSLYLLFCGALFFIQEKIVFRPEKISESYNYGIGQEVEIPLDENISMNALYIKAQAKKTSQKVILYLHGNRGSIRFGTYQIRQMVNHGHDILVPDYRGYGKTEGVIQNDQQLLEDAYQAFRFLEKKYGSENIIVIGYSLGSGMASYVASKGKPHHLIMIAPFTSLTDIKDEYLWFTPDFLLKYKLNSLKHLENVNSPITVLHGTADRVVKYHHSENLKKKFPKINLITKKGVGHRNIIFDGDISKVIRNLG